MPELVRATACRARECGMDHQRKVWLVLMNDCAMILGGFEHLDKNEKPRAELPVADFGTVKSSLKIPWACTTCANYAFLADALPWITC